MGKKSVTPDEIKRTLDHILPTVAKPGRYVGGELNSDRKRMASGSYQHSPGLSRYL